MKLDNRRQRFTHVSLPKEARQQQQQNLWLQQCRLRSSTISLIIDSLMWVGKGEIHVGTNMQLVVHFH